ncbi:cytochrome c oxidase assembly factor 4 homolog, mitochondrial [Abrus precatorius]|uniref:Cytochrome c oxidase assembly factor 4 homolog, mitochondrial n=1 Tax=Abrus precatorius TaxID=3816 RepID=A0A8B8JP87_ABRPR|nr:cytochrome c oxidase assembly factor 4 homolog, mitochondrial [Abrus precatorius]
MGHPPAKRSEAMLLARPPPKPVHQNDAEEDDDSVKQLGECSSLYLSMQDCVVRSNRNWKECQPEVEALRECFERRKKNKGK